MKFKVNGKTHKMKRLSELSFLEYNEIIVKREVSDIIDYLSVFSDSDRAVVLNSDVSIKNPSLPALHAAMFDVDQNKVMKDPKKTIFFKGSFVSMESVGIDTMGKDYLYDLYLKKLEEKRINIFEMSMYSLAIGLSETSDMDEVSDNYKILSQSLWVDVLPQGFFLIKNSKRKFLEKLKLYLIYISESKKMGFQMRYSLRKLAKQERKYLSGYFAKN